MSGFAFKQFKIQQSNTAMKVSTDGVMLGAWVNLNNTKYLLDIGCGTGLLSLMCKQRQPDLHVDAVEIDSGAVKDARVNIKRSPWSEITVYQGDIQSFECQCQFDVVICNPPYFNNSLKGPSKARNTARHTDSLTFEALINVFLRVSHRESRLAVILPCKEAQQLQSIASANGLSLLRHCLVSSTSEKGPTRSMMEFQYAQPYAIQVEALCIYQQDKTYSGDFIELCKDFYLKM
ncbi:MULTISPECIES: tRNA1(Val) (adenine(37)-N6)-methyltransferase [Pseudoalteromonas]|uniref:tRNA1(Val) (adenine(37)-N6)-methyltransferase n=1 Tax=Pseudoalteromonas amylolytica TaxID=1859457 RepID=A0A1S1MYB8_9GAMM|nr:MULTISPECIES: methyltransferase [Pseudoalteromonas]OHU89137.1 tRNA (adenosine(37)-N6)-methyltransferase TrmM [Pseudoalteromonas sp. JW3]OHU92037.1 tRNA (adenosine(37)-N6)-methyltransferase TrmM [Pseudoalteromonas amylolytica]